MASIISAGITSGTSLNLSGDTSGVLQLASNGSTTAVTINTSQKVGIGTASPTGKLHVYGSGEVQTLQRSSVSVNNYTLFKTEAGADQAYLGFSDTGVDDFAIYNVQNGYIRFGTNNAERMRIDSSGNVGIGTTNPSQKLHVDGGSGMSASALIARFFGTSGQSMLIRGNGNLENSLGSYGTISDAKLKENIVDATPKLDDINKLKVRNYNLIGNDLKQIGFVAQEIEQVFPNIVSESPDIDENGNDLGTTTKTVKTSVLIPILVKAMQELKAELDATKAEVQALKGVA